MAEVTRRLIEDGLRKLVPPEASTDALRIVGKYASGRADVAERHDDHLAEVFRT